MVSTKNLLIELMLLSTPYKNSEMEMAERSYAALSEV